MRLDHRSLLTASEAGILRSRVPMLKRRVSEIYKIEAE